MEKFETTKIFVKDKDELEMLQDSLKSPNIDQEIKPILEKFFTLPITPHESCYGHPENLKNPYLSYVDDETINKQDLKFQKLFKEKIKELVKNINKKIGANIVNIKFEEVNHGGKGPRDYVLQFEILDNNFYQSQGKGILDIIWQEFSAYLDKVARELG